MQALGNVPLAVAVLLAWTPIVVVLFRVLGRRRGTLVAVIGGYLLLPPTVVSLPGRFHDFLFDKQAAIGLALGVSMLAWDARTLLRFRPRPIDVPVLAFVAWAAAASVFGQYVEWEVATLILGRRVWWLAPYLAGRLYFGDVDGARRIAVGIVVASLGLVPVVVFESVLGPTWYLRTLIYGIPTQEITRLGGWRPEAFFDHGIEFSCWLALAAVMALWLWLGRVWSPRWGPSWGPGLLLVLATAATRSIYGYLDLAAGILALALTLGLRTRAAILALTLMAPLYVGLRVSGVWDGRTLVTMAGKFGRESTVAVRVGAEDKMIGAVLDHNPAFGFGRPLGVAWEDSTEDIVPGADGGWLVYLWAGGLIGLSIWLVALHLWPVGMALFYPWKRPRSDEIGTPVWGLALFLTLGLVDCLHNNPSFTPIALAAGSIVGLTLGGPAARTWTCAPRQGATGPKPTGARRRQHPASKAEVPSAVDLGPAAIVAAMACLLYVFGHGPVAGQETAKLIGGLGAALLFASAGWAGDLASETVPLPKLAGFAALFGAFGISFNLALHPDSRPWLAADILQGLATCGLVVACWRRLTGGRAWAEVLLAAAVTGAHLFVIPRLSAFPGSRYLFGQPLDSLALFPLVPWLTVALIGSLARRAETSTLVAATVVFTAAAGFSWWSEPGGPTKFPVNLSYALLSCAASWAAFAAARSSSDPNVFARGLTWLGRHWLTFFYVHFAVAAALSRSKVQAPWAVWPLLASGGLSATWLVALASAPFARWFRKPWTWGVLALLIVAAGAAPGLPKGVVVSLAGVAGLIFASRYETLAQAVAGAKTGASSRVSRPWTAPVIERNLARDLVRLAAVLAILAIPEILGHLTGKGTGPPPSRIIRESSTPISPRIGSGKGS